MKRFSLYTILAGLFLGSSLSIAQDVRAESAAETPALSTVADSLSKLASVGAPSFNKDAEYFIYLFSASWCGPCRRVMPQIVNYYKDVLSKDKRVEIILLDLDRTADAAKAYIAHYNVDFYTIMGTTPGIENQLPGAYQVRGIPHYIIVDKNGKKLSSGHAAGLIPVVQKLSH